VAVVGVLMYCIDSRPAVAPESILVDLYLHKDLTLKAKATAKDSNFVLGDISRPSTKAKDNNTVGYCYIEALSLKVKVKVKALISS